MREAIETRFSIRRFSPEPVPPGDLEEILRLASLAPSAWNLQPWRFLVVRHPWTKGALREAAYGQEALESAPLVIVLYSDMRDALETVDEVIPPQMPEKRYQREKETIRQVFGPMTEAERETWGAGQSYIALGHLMLAARSMGYDTLPMLGFSSSKVKEALGLSEHVQIPALVPLGVADEGGYPRHRHDLGRIVAFHDPGRGALR